jgi:hypothetical protein
MAGCICRRLTNDLQGMAHNRPAGFDSFGLIVELLWFIGTQD